MLIKIFIILIILSSLFLRYQSVKPKFIDGQRIKITTTLLSEPVIFQKRQYFKLLTLKVYLPLYPQLSYGDKVQIVGIVGGGTLKEPVLLENSESSNFIYNLRRRLLGVYTRSLPADEASLIAGVVIGSKSSISQTFWEKLKKSGTAHVVVASGMNVTLVGGFLMSIAVSFIKRGRAVCFVIVGIWLYCILSGLDAPIVRAGIMASIALLAQATGRLNKAEISLFVSAYLMLLINPLWITDSGFVLSFSATASIIFFSKKIKVMISRVTLLKYLPLVFRESLETTISAQFLVIPVLIFTFGQYNPLSIVANTLALWVIPLITIAGFVAGLVGLISFDFGRFLLLITYPLARYFTFIVGVFG